MPPLTKWLHHTAYCFFQGRTSALDPQLQAGDNRLNEQRSRLKKQTLTALILNLLKLALTALTNLLVYASGDVFSGTACH